jgi:catechol 2,3-dioxygenase
MNNTSIPAGAYIGHVHLKVADMEQSIRFYCDILGFELVSNVNIRTSQIYTLDNK